MPRTQSELKSTFGKGKDILFALLEAVEDAGGSDTDARRIVSDKKLRRQIGELLVNRQSFTVMVNYDDPRWQGIDRPAYYYINDSLTVADFPVYKTGSEEVDYEYVEFDHDPTTQEVLDEIDRRGLRVPDRAEAEVFLDKNPDEPKKRWIAALCGTVSIRYGYRGVADVDANGRCRGLDWDRLGNRWGRRGRFLAVRK